MPLIPKQQPPYYQSGTNVKIYTALITQTGTNAPTAIELQNDVGTEPWVRGSEGYYEKETNIPINYNIFINDTILDAENAIATYKQHFNGSIAETAFTGIYAYKYNNLWYLVLETKDATYAAEELSDTLTRMGTPNGHLYYQITAYKP